MLDKIRSLALEKLGSEEATDAFMAGFEKEVMEKAASQGQLFGSAFGGYARNFLGNQNVQKVGLGLGASLIGATLIKGLSAGSNAVTSKNLRGKFEMSLAQVMSSNKIVKGARPEKVKDFAETFFKFAPHVASDPNLLGSILANAVLGESIDPQTIKTLVELENKHVDNSNTSPWSGVRING